EGAHDRGANAAAAPLRDDRLVDDMQELPGAVDHDPPDRFSRKLDEVEAGCGEPREMAEALRVELLRHHLLKGGGREQGEFGRSRVAEQAVAEVAVFVAFRPQTQHADRQRYFARVVHGAGSLASHYQYHVGVGALARSRELLRLSVERTDNVERIEIR